MDVVFGLEGCDMSLLPGAACESTHGRGHASFDVSSPASLATGNCAPMSCVLRG